MRKEVLLTKSDKLLPQKQGKANLVRVAALDKLLSMYNDHTRSQHASDLHAIWMCSSAIKYLHFHSGVFKNSSGQKIRFDDSCQGASLRNRFFFFFWSKA